MPTGFHVTIKQALICKTAQTLLSDILQCTVNLINQYIDKTKH